MTYPDFLRGITILVVDDEPDSIEVARVLLEMAGATVWTCTNGAEALATLNDSLPDLILSDLSMPIMSGWELINALQQNALTRPIPAIALTAHAMMGDREQTIEAGFYSYISKPLDPETFVIGLMRLLQAHPKFADLLEN